MTSSPTTPSRPPDTERSSPPAALPDDEPSGRSLLAPRWILLHVLVVVAVLVMLRLGWWQVDRLQQRRAVNATVEERAQVDPIPLSVLVGGAGDDLDAVGEESEWQHVSMSGSYLPDDEVAVRNRSLDGAPGRWIVTPFRTDDGLVVAIVRGFVPGAVDDVIAPFEVVAPPTGEVRVDGYVQPTQERGSFGPTDPATGRLDEMARVDIARLDEQVDGELLPFWVQLAAQDPPTPSAQIAPVPLPPLDDGPHLGYAVQWAVFATIFAVGYPLAVRRRMKR